MSNHAQLSAGGIVVLSGVLFSIIVVALLVMPPAAEPTQPLSQQRMLVISATSDLAAVMERVGVAYAAANRGTRIKILHAAPDVALENLRRRRADLATIAATGPTLSSEWRRVPIARDGISVVVHSSNPIAILSDTDIADLYTGRIRNWKFVGGEDMPVAVRKKSAGHLETEMMLRFLRIENAERRAELALGDSEKLVHQVAENPEAFGISSVAVALRLIRMGYPVKLLALHQIPATEQDIRSGRFPLVSTTLLVASDTPGPLAESFMNFAQSAVTRDIYRAHALIEP